MEIKKRLVSIARRAEISDEKLLEILLDFFQEKTERNIRAGDVPIEDMIESYLMRRLCEIFVEEQEK